jgi:hypothetical protein
VSKALGVLVIFSLILCGCDAVYSRLPARFQPACSSQSAEFTANTSDILGRWHHTVAVAEGTSRNALLEPLTELQDLRKEAGELEAPECGLPVKQAMLEYMDYTVDGFLASMGQVASDAKIATLMLSSRMWRQSFESALEDLRADRPIVVATVEVPEPPSGLSAPARYEVTYRVSGSAREASVTFENARGGREQLERVRPPWEYSMRVDEGAFLFVSAQNEGDRGSITCEIEVDGRIRETFSSSGTHVIASCIGSAGGN